MALLQENEIIGLINAMIDGGIDLSSSRQVLFGGINPRFVAAIPQGATPTATAMVDLRKMNQVERLTTGEIPLQLYLTNASLLLSGTKEQLIIKATLDNIGHLANGSPRIDTSKAPEIKERIIHQDDMVSFSFMSLGIRAGASVMKLNVKSYENGTVRKNQSGNDVIFLGTGWLLTPSLVMTNHHVLNARGENEPTATDVDLHMQASNTIGQLDFDADGQNGISITFKSLMAWDQRLDYAVVQIDSTDRAALQRVDKAIVKGNDPIPVNIIQHPNGKPKRYAIRNNLVGASSDTDLRYFTDTDAGSSGSPVFNDQWKVVALHRGSTFVNDVKFQGKDTAYLNVGTHITSIMNDISNRYPGLHQQIINNS